MTIHILKYVIIYDTIIVLLMLSVLREAPLLSHIQAELFILSCCLRKRADSLGEFCELYSV